MVGRVSYPEVASKVLPGQREQVIATSKWPSRMAVALVVILYLSAIVFTNAHFMADSGGYVVSILAYYGVSEYVVQNPVVRDYRSENPFWDFGHLLWRPFGLVLFRIFGPLARNIVGPDPSLNVIFLLMSVNFLAGLLAVLLLYKLTEKLTGRRWVAVLVSIAFIFSHGFLNFSQTGSPYIVGLACLIPALYLLLDPKDNPTTPRAILAGLALTGSVTMWALYVLAIPAAIAAPIVIFGLSKPRNRLVFQTAAALLLATSFAYGTAMVAIGVNSPSELREWIAASSHGVRTSGLSRTLFGLPRSFIHMGNDGVLFKRFLFNDPFNPVSAVDLVRANLWKLALFYLAIGSVVISLFFSPARRILLLLLLNAAPVIVFAILFDGGAVERYLPLYPLVFISVALTCAASGVPRILKFLPIIVFSIAAVVNSSAMARIVLERQQRRTAERVENVLPQLKPNSWLVTTHLQDDIVNFQASFPFEPINRFNTYHVYPLINVNTIHAAKWREEFASAVLEAWAKGGDAWLSKRLFNSKPQAEWNWAEGDDPHVRWRHLHEFFAKLDTGVSAGGVDGFVLLEKSEANIQFLSSTTSKTLDPIDE